MKSDIELLKQKEFSNEIVLVGFPELSNEQAVLIALRNLFPNSAKDITGSDCWSTASNNIVTGFMMLRFVDKNSQIKFMKSKIQHGPIYHSDLSQESQRDQPKIIYFNNRLSRENVVIFKRIRELIKAKKIVKCRLRDCQLQVKLEASSDFVATLSLDHLNKLVK
jgi:hypothetical protein